MRPRQRSDTRCRVDLMRHSRTVAALLDGRRLPGVPGRPLSDEVMVHHARGETNRVDWPPDSAPQHTHSHECFLSPRLRRFISTLSCPQSFTLHSLMLVFSPLLLLLTSHNSSFYKGASSKQTRRARLESFPDLADEFPASIQEGRGDIQSIKIRFFLDELQLEPVSNR